MWAAGFVLYLQTAATRNSLWIPALLSKWIFYYMQPNLIQPLNFTFLWSFVLWFPGWCLLYPS